MDRRQNAVEPDATDGDLGEFENDGLGMSNNSGTNPDQHGLKAGQRPIRYLFEQISALQEDTEIVSERIELKPNFVLHNSLAGQPGPLDRLLALLDVLLCRSTLIVEADVSVWLHWKVRHD